MTGLNKNKKKKRQKNQKTKKVSKALSIDLIKEKRKLLVIRLCLFLYKISTNN